MPDISTNGHSYSFQNSRHPEMHEIQAMNESLHKLLDAIEDETARNIGSAHP